MALDIGDARIGLALSDPMGIIANPLETYLRKKNEEDYRYLAALAREKQAGLIVCGLPVSMNSGENDQTRKTREFISKLGEYTTIPVTFIDERLTTVSAEKALIEGGVRREKRKTVIDKVAAAIILQNYLDYYHKK